MQFTLEQLQTATGIEVIPVWVKAGVFSHRHPKDKADPIQIERRQEYLDRVPNGEWLLVMDSDEILLGGLEMIAPVLAEANLDHYPHLPSPMGNCTDDCGEIGSNRVDCICISEILPDLTIVNRPRFIKKVEGLKYGGPDKKHDYIEYINKYEDPTGYVTEDPPVNYINPKILNPYMWTMEGVFFWHNKNGALKIYQDDEGREMKAFNLVSVRHIETNPHPQKGCRQYDHGGWTHDAICGVTTSSSKPRDKYDMYKEIVRD